MEGMETGVLNKSLGDTNQAFLQQTQNFVISTSISDQTVTSWEANGQQMWLA